MLRISFKPPGKNNLLLIRRDGTYFLLSMMAIYFTSYVKKPWGDIKYEKLLIYGIALVKSINNYEL